MLGDQPTLGARLGRLLDAAYGLVRAPGDTEVERLQKSIVMLAIVIGVPFTGLSALLAVFVGGPAEAVWALLAFVALLCLVFVVFATTNKWFRTAFGVVMAANLILAGYVTWAYGGIVQSGGNALWAIVPPVLALLIFGRRAGLWWFGAYLVVLSWSIFGIDDPAIDSTITSTFGSVLIGVSVFIFVMFLYFTSQRDRAQDATDTLLHNVLPDEIVTRLKAGEGVIADSFEGASVLFADIADFTPMSSAMAPDELVDLLNRVFTEFDRLADDHGVEKIKTIGDCYMAASGVPVARHDHAAVLADMALAMQDVVAAHRYDGRNLQFRIGINSGPLTAGVIGQQKFIYDLWGDTVNTASRMESHGIAGEIQLTPATARLLDGDFVISPRGEVDVKGKGRMEVFMLEGRAG